MRLVAALLLPARVMLVLTCVLLGLVTQLAFFTWLSPKGVRSIVSVWSRITLACMGVKLQIQHSQASSQRTMLVVSNHISWLDILALQAVMPVVFVAKSDIKSWPVIGWMVSLAGTCFIDRTRRTALRTVHSTLTTHLQAGQSVCIFPEGTTSDGRQVLPFHAGLLQAAIEARVPVQPVCLNYSNQAAAYIDDMTLIGSLGAILLTPNLSVTINALPTLSFEATTRQTLSQYAHKAIESAVKH